MAPSRSHTASVADPDRVLVDRDSDALRPGRIPRNVRRRIFQALRDDALRLRRWSLLLPDEFLQQGPAGISLAI